MPITMGSVIGCVYRTRWEGQIYNYTHTWQVALTSSTQSVPRDLQDITNEFAAAGLLRFSNLYRTCISEQVTVFENTAQVLWPLRSVRVVRIQNDPGLAAGAASTGNVAAVFTIRTQTSGRSEVSNKHIGPLSANDYGNGVITGALSTALAIFAARHTASLVVPLTDLNSITLIPVIAHRATKTSSITDSISVSDRVGTMRRRTLRVGE